MNPLMFFGSKVNEDPQDFSDEINKIVHAMGVTSNQEVDLVTYQLKDVTLLWYTEWRHSRAIKAGSVSWEVFRKGFLDRFFPGEAKV